GGGGGGGVRRSAGGGKGGRPPSRPRFAAGLKREAVPAARRWASRSRCQPTLPPRPGATALRGARAWLAPSGRKPLGSTAAQHELGVHVEGAQKTPPGRLGRP